MQHFNQIKSHRIMKNLLQKTALLLFISAFEIANASAQIPNNNFELWEWSVLGGENPNEWYTSNGDLIPVNVFKDSLTQYSGNYAVMLTNIVGVPGTIGCGFPISYHPFQLKGYFKSEFISADTASIKISLFNNNQVVDSGEYLITTSIANWTSIAITISMNSTIIDSAAINITACNQQQNKCWVDLLTLEEPSSSPTISETNFSLFPNPAFSQLTVGSLQYSESCAYSVGSIKIVDVMGKTVYQESEPRETFRENHKSKIINLQSFSPGIYFLEIESEGKFYRESFVKE